MALGGRKKETLRLWLDFSGRLDLLKILSLLLHIALLLHAALFLLSLFIPLCNHRATLL